MYLVSKELGARFFGYLVFPVFHENKPQNDNTETIYAFLKAILYYP